MPVRLYIYRCNIFKMNRFDLHKGRTNPLSKDNQIGHVKRSKEQQVKHMTVKHRAPEVLGSGQHLWDFHVSPRAKTIIIKEESIKSHIGFVFCIWCKNPQLERINGIDLHPKKIDQWYQNWEKVNDFFKQICYLLHILQQ